GSCPSVVRPSPEGSAPQAASRRKPLGREAECLRDLEEHPGHETRAFHEILLLVIRWLVVVLLVLTVATTFATDQDGPWLTGQFLVATEQLGDPPVPGAGVDIIRQHPAGAVCRLVN